ncbi:MAG: purine-binding chemotaxis protein CheW [Chloroflexi bacterium]|nr:purine-binding chemotaxis protein CheW [Chloroflexota bacterium]
MTERANWQDIHAKLERARQALEAGASLPPEEVRRILRDRALALAKPPEEAPAPGNILEILVFSLAGERCGIETAHVLEVVPLRELTPVPCTPPFYLGVMNHRGRILPVLDFRRLFGLAGQGVTEGSRVVAVEAGGMTFGIFAEAVGGTTRVGAQQVAPPPITLSGERQAFVRGVTGEMIAVLDLEAMARDPRIVVNEEVG